jgi:hypothetical protein
MARSFILASLLSGLACSSNGSLKELGTGTGSMPGFMLPDSGRGGAGGPAAGGSNTGDPIGTGGASGTVGAGGVIGAGGVTGAGGASQAAEDAQTPPPAEVLPPPPPPDAAPNGNFINTVFIVVEGSADWENVPEEMPFLTDLLRVGAHSEQYYNPPGVLPTELNYLWMEAGSTLGLTSTDDPAASLVRGANHLTKLLDAAGISWTSYQEDISPGQCPITNQAGYVTNHNPFVFFDDVVGDPPSVSAPKCIAHHKPFSQFAADLKAGTVARYNFITPNLLHDSMDGSQEEADAWLRANIDPIWNPLSPSHNPAIWAHAAVFIVWDGGEAPSDGPSGMVVMSPFAKPGYQDTTSPDPYHYTHGSLLRTVQEIFGVAGTPLGAAAQARNLSDFFTRYP